MKIEKIEARQIRDSRKEPTIEISVFTEKGKFDSSAPSGKSRGRFEAKPYARSLQTDINFINNLKIENFKKLKIEEFKDLKEIEGIVNGKIGANSSFVLEASILKALAAEQRQELWQLLSRGKPRKFPFPVGNTIEGGVHNREKGKKPDFQEFLFISKAKSFFDRVFINKQAYKITEGILKAKKITDEGAWHTPLDNEKILEVMNIIKHEVKKQFGEGVEIGVDAAASTFFTGKFYNYKNKKQRLNKEQQINYIADLAKNYDLDYIEDPLEQEDFYGFSELKEKTRSLIVGDDLTVTNLTRLKKAMQNKNGSLLKVREICDFCRDKGIKIVFSHRSGETMDSVIADLAVAWKADFIKTGIYGKEREVKLKRLMEIEKSL
jgi:enolase